MQQGIPTCDQIASACILHRHTQAPSSSGKKQLTRPEKRRMLVFKHMERYSLEETLSQDLCMNCPQPTLHLKTSQYTHAPHNMHLTQVAGAWCIRYGAASHTCCVIFSSRNGSGGRRATASRCVWIPTLSTTTSQAKMYGF